MVLLIGMVGVSEEVGVDLFEVREGGGGGDDIGEVGLVAEEGCHGGVGCGWW